MTDSKIKYESKRKQLIALRATGRNQIAERERILKAIARAHGGEKSAVSVGVWAVLEREAARLARSK